LGPRHHALSRWALRTPNQGSLIGVAQFSIDRPGMQGSVRPNLFQILHANFVGRQLASSHNPTLLAYSQRIKILEVGTSIPRKTSNSQTLSRTQVAAKLVILFADKRLHLRICQVRSIVRSVIGSVGWSIITDVVV